MSRAVQLRILAIVMTATAVGGGTRMVRAQTQPAAARSDNAVMAEQVLTVMARTPVPGKNETAITAFLVTPDMPGFEVTEPRMEKLGIRGTATARLAFRDQS